jgi:hypothetical protein
MHILRLEVKTNDGITEIMPILGFQVTNEEIHHGNNAYPRLPSHK